jgi:hypothetical protein
MNCLFFEQNSMLHLAINKLANLLSHMRGDGRSQAEGRGRGHLREFGEGAGAKLDHCGSRRDEKRCPGVDPRHGRLSFLQRERDSRRRPQADGLLLRSDGHRPSSGACGSRIDMGGIFTARTEGARQGVEFTIVYSAHVNDVSPSLLSQAEQDLLKADGVQLSYGPPVGFVVKFTNGLVAYLTSDTTVFGDMKTVIHDFYRANSGPDQISD